MEDVFVAVDVKKDVVDVVKKDVDVVVGCCCVVGVVDVTDSCLAFRHRFHEHEHDHDRDVDRTEDCVLGDNLKRKMGLRLDDRKGMLRRKTLMHFHLVDHFLSFHHRQRVEVCFQDFQRGGMADVLEEDRERSYS